MKHLILILMLFNTAVNAAVTVFEFDNEAQNQRYKNLIAELRCLVCQNQNLADSNADLAIDLKNIVYHKIIEGETDQQILDFMTQRYGDFVLYRPPLQSNTVLLWLGPIIFLMIALSIMVIYIKTRKRAASFQPSEQQRTHIRKLLDE